MKRGSDGMDPPSAKRVRGHLNRIPDLSNDRLNVYMFGSGSICELGLGPRVVEVKRPRLNPLIPAKDVGIVAVATGGAHSLGIDAHGHVWSWGQNDSGTLSRHTKEEEDEMDEDNDINPKESTPTRVEGLPEKDVFVAVGCTDNLSVAITDSGRVWAWGTFIDDGRKFFTSGVKIQYEPFLLPNLRHAVSVVGGKDHVLVLDRDGRVWVWGLNESHQLGMQSRVNRHRPVHGPVRLPSPKKVKSIAAGDYTSFAIDEDGRLWAWGLNNFGQCGIADDVGANVSISKPTIVEFFEGKPVKQVASGAHHSVFLLQDGSIYTSGETNFHQLGIPYDALPEDTVREKSGDPSYVPTPTKLTKGSFEEEAVALPKMKYVAAGTDHSLAISAEDGSTWTWGFGEVYQLGHGKPAGEDSPEDEPVPTRIKNTATTGVDMVWAGAGGQFSVIAAVAPASEQNGSA